MNRCEQELCELWTGQGCACEVIGLEPVVSSLARGLADAAAGRVYEADFREYADDDEDAQ